MHHFLLPILLLSSLLTSSQSPINPSSFPSSILTLDYGRIIFNTPSEVLEPKTSQDISDLIRSVSSSPYQSNMTIAPRGAGHSTYGQAQSHGGIVINMLSLPSSIRIIKTSEDNNYVDAGGGSLWIDVLKETLKHGLTPRSWTDYLHLTVGGTLSVGGISGQTYKYGPQISNVIELDVITGKGEHLTCSYENNSDLFYGVLGGLGQFGIITRARIILKHAPQMAKRVIIPYDDFNQFTRDGELLILKGDVDYLEGFVKFKNITLDHLSNGIPSGLYDDSLIGSQRLDIYYSLEMAIYYDEERTAQKILDRVLSQLKIIKSMVCIVDVSYFDFLNRVRVEEEDLRRKGLWDVAHPWLNLFVPRFQIGRFKELLLETITKNIATGPIIIYPTLRQKWNPKMSMVLPQDDAESNIMYVASVLRAASPSCTYSTPCLEGLLRQNQKIINIATAEPSSHCTPTMNVRIGVAATLGSRVAIKGSCMEEGEGEVEIVVGGGEDGMGAKQYMPYFQSESEWKVHFGEEGWERFKKLKSRFDPLNILTPGQRIFERKVIEG